MSTLRLLAAAARASLLRPRPPAAALLPSAPRAFASTALAPQPDVYDLRREGAAIQVPRPPKKLAKAAAHVAARLALVRAGLASQDKKRAEYKKTLPLKARNRGLLYLIKKNAWEKGAEDE